MRSLRVSDPLDRAKGIAPRVTELADTIDRDRQLPAELIHAMRDAGLFRLLIPRAYGGEEMDWVEYLDVVRSIAYADGSAGWCLNQGAVYATTACRAPRSIAKAIWGDENTIVANGPPQGTTSEEVSGGYLLNGNWMFSSGCRHANWIAALSVGSGQRPRLHLLPKEEVKFEDVWQVQGLRGTGSFSFSARDHFVPEDRAFFIDVQPFESGALYLIPQALLFACGFGCVALGVARAGIDAAIEVASEKTARDDRKTRSDNSVVQSQIGKAEAGWRAAKALLHETVSSVWDDVKNSGEITVQNRILLRMAGTHAIRESARVVDISYNACGSTAIFSDQKIQRRFQDAHVITQQIQGREAHYETVGQYFLGDEPRGIY